MSKDKASVGLNEGQRQIAPCPSTTTKTRKYQTQLTKIDRQAADFIGADSGLVARAYRFARDAHSSILQARKNSDIPYITHPLAVARVVASVTHTPEMLAAALLHDVVDDTQVSLAQVRSEFGTEVADLVNWLSDQSSPETGNRSDRKALERAHIDQAPADAKTIRLADLVHNLSTVEDLSPKFRLIYLAEKELLLPHLAGGDAGLYGQVAALVVSGLQRFTSE